MSISLVLSFDYGTKRIGVAVGQKMLFTANPLAVVRVINDKPDWSHISLLMKRWQPDVALVGLPRPADNSKNHVMSRCAENFAAKLGERFQLPVHMVDERLSSREAARRGNSSGTIDSVAAQIILEDWFVEQRRALS